MELTRFLAALAVFLPIVYGAPTNVANSLHPEVLAAMKRDLGLDAVQATARVAREVAAADVIEKLETASGASFAGAWLSDDGATVNVGVTDESLVEELTALGGSPVVVSSSLKKLQDAQKKLDKIEIPQTFSESEEGIAVWFVDVIKNKLVIEATEGSLEQAEGLAKEVGLVEGEFEIVKVNELPTTFATIRGGDAYYINRGGRCSIGFAVTTGFVTAGHCGTSGASATNSAGAALGTFAGSSFPGNDYAFVRAATGSTLSPTVNGYGGSGTTITGSTATRVGGSICRSGSTTGVYCGTVSQLGATVNYSQGSVSGLTRTNVCAEPGDSGGSWYTGGQAQGVTSGGSGNCASGGTTYFQPVNEILSAYGLTLVRG